MADAREIKDVLWWKIPSTQMWISALRRTFAYSWLNIPKEKEFGARKKGSPPNIVIYNLLSPQIHSSLQMRDTKRSKV